MSKLLLALLLCTFSLIADDLVDAVEFRARGGIPNFIKKVNAGKSVKIGYLGGSITAQKGYRVLSRKWFQEKYPNAKIDEINAAIGGTGSELGVFRVDADVLKHKPDLLFIEFAVNDGGTSKEVITRAFEGIIRKTWKLNPETDICFVYTLTHRMLETLQDAKFPRAASFMEGIADHYNIPSIHMGLEVANMEKAGTLIMKGEKGKMTAVSGNSLNEGSGQSGEKIVFSKDGVHPYTDSGHGLYMKAIERSMKTIIPAGSPAAHVLPKPLRDDHWESAGKLNVSKIKNMTNLERLPTDKGLGKRFGSRMPEMWVAKNPGTVLEFKFKGKYLGFYDLVGPDCGSVEVEVDGKKRTFKRMDGYCTYNRLSMLVVNKNLEDKVHTVKVSLTNEKLDKKNILFERNRAQYDKNPKKFEPHFWYLGGVFISGELVD
ncbi:MAG: SGNH/GDSL hydrolase family protein [Lentisphaeraceae bacterium]|nr:SGNH/GDSL hydrolase family protein [Lentisphaeraceae bacterium]